MIPTSVAVGLSNEGQAPRVMLVNGHVSTTLSTTVAKMIATQLIMAADLIDDLGLAPDNQVPS